MKDNSQQVTLEEKLVQDDEKRPDSNDVGEKPSPEAVTQKRAYTKPALRKFSQIDYVTAYGID